VGAFGFSAGGATVILTAAQDTRLRAVVAVGNYADMQADVYRGARFWRHPYEWWIRMWVGFFFEQRAGIRLAQNRPIAALPSISPRPVLLIHGANEVEPAQGWAQFASAGPPKALYIMPGAGHGDYMAVDSAAYSARLRLFFDTYLLGEKTVDG
jgi:dipeptidyl aminopeptidase/acylaminoacyl peptidase